MLQAGYVARRGRVGEFGKLAARWLERSRILHISPSENARNWRYASPSRVECVLHRSESWCRCESPLDRRQSGPSKLLRARSTSTRVLRRGSSFLSLSLSPLLALCPRDISVYHHPFRWPRWNNDKILRSFNEVTANERPGVKLLVLSSAC